MSFSKNQIQANSAALEKPFSTSHVMIESIFDAAFSIDNSKRIVLANESAHLLLGYPPGELIGIDIGDLFPEYVDSLVGSDPKMTTTSPISRTNLATHRSGKSILVQWREAKFSDNERVIVFRELESSLYSKKLHDFKRVSKNLDDIICVDPEDFSRIHFANQEFNEIFELPDQQETVANAKICSFMHPKNLSRWEYKRYNIGVSQRNLEDKLALTRPILDSLPQQIVFINRSATILDANLPWKNAILSTGFESCCVGMNYFILLEILDEFLADSKVAILNGIKNVLLGKCKEYLAEYRCHDDRWRSIQATRLCIDEITVAISQNDITVQKRSELIARENGLKFRELFRNSPLPAVCWKKTEDGFVVGEFNDEAIRVTNGEVLKTIGSSLDQLHASNKTHRANILRSYETKSAFTVEDHWTNVSWGGPLGEENDVLVSYAFVPPDIVTVSLVIITERNQQQAALRETKEQSRMVLAALSEGVIFLDPDGKVVLCNESAAKILGQSVLRLVGESLAGKIGDYLRDDRGLFYTSENLPWDPARLQGKSCLGIAVILLREDGITVRLMMNAHPLNQTRFDGTSEVVISFTDVTAQWNAETQMQSHQAELTHVARLSTIGEMAAMLAHELNQPLSSIVNFCQGCVNRLQKGESSGVLEAMQTASSEARRAAAYIRKIREFVRKREPHRSSVNLNEVVSEVVELLRPEARLLEIRMKVIPGVDLPQVQADSIQMEQVLLNIIRNSFDALSVMPIQDRQISIETSRNCEGGVLLRVSDSGHGMSPEVMSKLFEPFNTTKPQGMGLGLTICRGIVESHGGRMFADPNVVGGSVFTVELPENKE